MLFEQSASKLHQIALQWFMERGHLNNHLRKMRKIYQEKHDLLLQSIQKHFNDRVTIYGRNAGFRISIDIQSSKSEKELIIAAKEASIRVSPAIYKPNKEESKRKKFIIGFSGIEKDKIEEGIQLLSQVWKE